MKKSTQKIVFVLSILTFAINIFADVVPQQVTPLQNGDKVLFIGNSFTEWSGPLPAAIQSLLNANGKNISVSFTLKTKGEGILKQYATWSSLGMMDEIRKSGWKYVVVQGWRDAIDWTDGAFDEAGVAIPDHTVYPNNKDTMLKYLKIIDTEIKKVGATTILYQPHVGKNNFMTDHDKCAETYPMLWNNVSCFWAPVIQSWDSIWTRYPSAILDCKKETPGSFMDFMYGDCGHQNTNGMMLDALTFYTIFTQMSGARLNPSFKGSMLNPEYYEELADIGYKVGKNILNLNNSRILDTAPPTLPTGLTVSNILPDYFKLSWNTSTDDIGVLGYEVFRNNELIGTSAFPNFAVNSGLKSSTTYTMKIRAIDSEGKKSDFTPDLLVTTGSLANIDTTGVLMAWDFKACSSTASVSATSVMKGISSTVPSGIINVGPTFIANTYNGYTNAFTMRKQTVATLADAITGNSYFTFSITPGTGNVINVDSVLLRPIAINSNRNYTLMSSVKPFIEGNELGTLAITKSNTQSQPLKSIKVSGVTGVSSTIEFRVYVWGTAGLYDTFGLGNSDIGISANDLLIYGRAKSSNLSPFPTNLTATELTETGFKLNWNAAANASSYEIFKDGVSVGKTTNLYYSLSNVSINASYSMTVKGVLANETYTEESIPLLVKIPDLQIPSVPTNLWADDISFDTFTLHWDACTDNVGVTLYEIFQDGVNAGNTGLTNLPLPFQTPGTTYSLQVRAKDAAGNVSALSNPITVKTLLATSNIELSKNDILLYPNPVSDILTISGLTNNTEINVFNMNGIRLIRSIANTTKTELDLSALKQGIYVLKLTDSDRILTKMIVRK